MIIEKELKEKLTEKWNNLSFYFLEKYDSEFYVSFDLIGKPFIDEESLFESEKCEYMKMMEDDKTILEFLEIMPHNHTFDIHVQEPSLHVENIYPMTENDKPRFIVYSEFDENMNPIEPSYDVSEFKEEIRFKNINQLEKNLEMLESISSGYQGIEIIDNETQDKYIVLSPSYLLLERLINTNSEETINECIYEFMKRQELSILKEIYPQYTKNIEYVMNVFFKKIYDKVKYEVENKTEFYNKAPNVVKKWIDTLISLKADTKNKEYNIWKVFNNNNISYETMTTTYQLL